MAERVEAMGSVERTRLDTSAVLRYLSMKPHAPRALTRAPRDNAARAPRDNAENAAPGVILSPSKDGRACRGHGERGENAPGYLGGASIPQHDTTRAPRANATHAARANAARANAAR